MRKIICLPSHPFSILHLTVYKKMTHLIIFYNSKWLLKMMFFLPHFFSLDFESLIYVDMFGRVSKICISEVQLLSWYFNFTTENICISWRIVQDIKQTWFSGNYKSACRTKWIPWIMSWRNDDADEAKFCRWNEANERKIWFIKIRYICYQKC